MAHVLVEDGGLGGNQPGVEFGEHSVRELTPLPPWMFETPDLHDRDSKVHGCDIMKTDSDLEVPLQSDIFSPGKEEHAATHSAHSDVSDHSHESSTGTLADADEQQMLVQGKARLATTVSAASCDVSEGCVMAVEELFCYMGGLLIVKAWLAVIAGRSSWQASATCQELALRQQFWVDSWFELDPDMYYQMAMSTGQKQGVSNAENVTLAALQMEAASHLVDSWFELT
mmetsp:Transcript_699/g.1199  ORF Transcript_699/g.1199 Transcript_699/m.1199 type:complete len:228 (+) Transcript_699:89-772(+)|eukprot:CAMPEP_0197628454 /NCGR_PEP_ID=MMETSP1338-20131121/6763_1 /TAXON_ID=43686 ORGANISM="Pelagodinium beii, Strain RCC1491" /NCGR_SAMPLE_ID=MMETSP1338 /ASSEMBLY_ACC=CAM_ASM_000754 /LENGTH=227 /DNA_ID=CAMNT_0043199435 /DNA_START=83 /DNA_END=766 /DNA_ORIENTATION=-